ncbi:helix-turn-helix domain-containing protein [Paraflavitalea pollutisoli]|uniref:helix-turn-helix domain-containing protein n=1 Tax=Paraflavitalea pollutisoli TaxID=3034143 RepID=UPI0023ED0880|nr:helix-turn-helix transcriptional regulator [Paraflavitalea sp. H1-2-19X]
MATKKKTPVKTYSKLNIDFGEHLRSLRKEKGLSLRQMEEQCDLDNSNISKIENGKFDIQLSTIVELAKGLNVHPRELLDYRFI